MNVELDLATGERGSRQPAVGRLLARLCGAEAAMVVNNNAAAVLLVLAALARGRQVLVSRGESVEIGGGFRVPEVMEQSAPTWSTSAPPTAPGSPTTARRSTAPRADVALVLKVHPSNYRVEGFVEDTSVAQLATLGVPVVADIGSGLIDATCPWLPGPPPAWLAGEPAARQTLAAGADAGDVQRRQAARRAAGRHHRRPRRPGRSVRAPPAGPRAAARRPACWSRCRTPRSRTCDRTAATDIPFWQMVATPVDELRDRAERDRRRARASARSSPARPCPAPARRPGTTIPSRRRAA